MKSLMLPVAFLHFLPHVLDAINGKHIDFAPPHGRGEVLHLMKNVMKDLSTRDASD